MGPRIFIRGVGGWSNASEAHRSFNGAADLHPRRVTRSGSVASGSQKLQWGRGASSAECANPVVIAQFFTSLQWGGGSSSAEWPRLAAPESSVLCFNGAAD